jgi:hypothetical protein
MKLTGGMLILASLTFWLAWRLMPGVGVTDTATIFALVGAHRGAVLASVVLQLVSASAYVLGAIGLAGRTRAGAVLLALGALGSAADAIYHLVAFEMTAPGLDRVAMTPVMQRLQGPDLAFLLPFVAAFFVAHGTIAWARRREARVACWLLVTAPGAAFLGGLALLAVTSTSLALVGASIARERC